MIASDVGTISSRRSRVYGFLIASLALLWVGGIVSYAGNALPDPRANKIHRFCGGKCLCDGGVANASLMARVCPEGWQEAYGVARRKVIRKRNMRRQILRKRLQATPPRPESQSGPNV
jgi:hypothetical protein